MPNIQHQLLSTTDSGKLVYQLGTDSPQQVSTTTGAIQTPHPRHWHYKRTEQNDLTLLTDRDWPITTNLRHLSLTGHNITAKLTNQFIQTGLRTFNWQQLFTWLWRWLPFWLSKRQSPLPTTVLLRTTPTPRIKLHYYMLLPGSNHLPQSRSCQEYVFFFCFWDRNKTRIFYRCSEPHWQCQQDIFF